jgi:hypothetical protein
MFSLIPQGLIAAKGPVFRGERASVGKGLAASAPALVVVSAAVTLWLITGVSAGDAAVFVAYHCAFVILPGWVIYRLLRPGDRLLFRQLVFGWALGYVCEILAFVVCAALHVRPLLALYPLLVLAIGGVLWRRRVSSTVSEHHAHRRVSSSWRWAVAGLCVAALVFQGVEYFGTAPLPNHVTRVSYGVDTVWYLSLAGEALHHWPVTDPTVSGQPLYYHLFSSFDPAAISQVTGLDLTVVFFRLYTVPLLLLSILALCVAGMSFGAVWTGPLAAALALFVGEINLDPHVGYRFANELSDDVLAISPSFLIGVALLAPLLAILCELAGSAGRRLKPEGGRRMSYGKLAVFGLLVLGMTGAKAPMPTVLGGGLLLYLVWHAVRHRALHREIAAALVVTVGVFACFWAISYQGAGSDQLTLSPPGIVRQMQVTSHISDMLGLHGAWGALAWVALAAVGVVGAYGAQLVGLLAVKRDERPPATPIMLAVLLFGLLPFLLYTHPGYSQVFFSESGLLAAVLISAQGIWMLWTRAEDRTRLALFAVGCLVLAVLVSLTLSTGAGVRDATARMVYLDIDFALAALLACVYLLAPLRRLMNARRVGYLVVATLAVGLIGRVITVAGPTASELVKGRPLYSQAGPGLTAGLYRALAWIRTHSSPTAVIAVNNFRDWSLYWSDGWAVPEDFNYSAFAERPTFLEGYIYTQAATEAPRAVYYGHALLFQNRLALNNAIFQWAHGDALRTAAGDYGVRYLLVDRVHNRANVRLGTIARLVYANHDAQVYSVPIPASRRPVALRRVLGSSASPGCPAAGRPGENRSRKLATPSAASKTRNGSIPARKRINPVIKSELSKKSGNSHSQRGACRTRAVARPRRASKPRG